MAIKNRYLRGPIKGDRAVNKSLRVQLALLVLGLPAAIVGIVVAAGSYWLGAMIGTAFILVVVFILLTAISLLRS